VTSANRVAPWAASQSALWLATGVSFGRSCADTGVPASDFVPIVTDSYAGSDAAVIEIAIGGAMVRVGPGVELAFLGEVLRLLKATA
jgi:hypothetical protein